MLVQRSEPEFLSFLQKRNCQVLEKCQRHLSTDWNFPLYSIRRLKERENNSHYIWFIVVFLPPKTICLPTDDLRSTPLEILVCPQDKGTLSLGHTELSWPLSYPASPTTPSASFPTTLYSKLSHPWPCLHISLYFCLYPASLVSSSLSFRTH